MSSDNKEKKKKFSTALRDIKKYHKKLNEKCGHFQTIEEWSSYAEEAIQLLAKHDILPEEITSSILDALRISQHNTEVVNSFCETLDDDLDELEEWINEKIQDLLNDPQADEPMRTQYMRSPSTRNNSYPQNTMSRGSGTKIIVGIIIAIVIGGGFFYLYGDKILPTQTQTLILRELSPYSGEEVGTRTVNLSVRVMDQNLNPVSGATVTFQTDGEFFQNVSTNSNGYATSKNWAVVSGSHSWEAFAYKSGYKNSASYGTIFMKR